MATVNVRVDDATRERWQVAAEKAGVPLAQYVRGCVESVIAGPSGRAAFPAGIPDRSPLLTGQPTPGGCRNRQRHKKGVRCGYCGVVP
jgi:hypothetical protein